MPKKFTKENLEVLLRDVREEDIAWRDRADIEAAYFDGKQLTQAQLTVLDDRGLPPLSRNLIAPSVNLVTGMERKNRRNWKVSADDDNSKEVAIALSPEMVKLERTTNSDEACSQAFESQAKVGLGWVEVAKETDPFKPKYRIRFVHRREMIRDWRSTEWDMSDARYLARWRWIDIDSLLEFFPKQKTKIKNLGQKVSDWDDEMFKTVLMTDGKAGLWELDEFETIQEREWRDAERERVKLYEVWYRYFVQGHVLRFNDGRVVEYNPKNIRHDIAIGLNQVKLEASVFPKIRRSFFAGPTLLDDGPSPYAHNRFPYVPFWGFREDSSGAPYGIIRSMVSPQDEVNARLSKMMWLLSAKRIIADADALDMPIVDAVTEAARADGVILLNEKRRNKTADAFRIEQDFTLSREQFTVMQDAAGAIKNASGISDVLLGQGAPSDSSKSQDSLIEQGSTTLATLFANFNRSRMLVGELAFSMLKEEIGNKQLDINDVEIDGSKKTVSLNKVEDMGGGITGMSNSLAHSKLTIGLEDVPDTPSYKRMLMAQFAEITKSLPPEVQSLFADFMVRISDMPFRDEMVERLQKHFGLGEDQGPDPAEQLELERLQLELDKLRAEIDKIVADTQSTAAKATNLDAHTERALSETATQEDAHSMEMVERAVEVTTPKPKPEPKSTKGES